MALLTTAALGAWVVMHLRQEPSTPSVMRFSIPPPEKATFSANTTNVVLSPDGRRVAFLAAESGRSVRLWVRPLDSLTSEPLAGTDDANVPF